MSIHKRIQTLTNFILQLEPHKHIPEIKKHIELLKTALHTLKHFSNDKSTLKTTLNIMKQTISLLEKYGVHMNTEEDMRDEHIESEHINGGIDGSDSRYGRGGDIQRFTNEGGGEEVESLNLNYIEKNKSLNNDIENIDNDEIIQKKFSIDDLQQLPDDVIFNLNDILNNFRRTRNAQK